MNKVYAASHPLRAQRDCYEVPEGSTVKEIVDLVDDNSGLRKHFVVHVGGRVVPQEYWQYVTPKANTNIAIRAVPMGGGDDKDPLRTVLTIVVAVAAAWVTAGAGGLITSSTTASVAGAAVSIVGRLLVDAIAPPPSPEEQGGLDEDPRQPGIENARNRAQRYQPIPRIYGTYRFVPPYSVLPYTEVRGNDQYLHFAVCWGYGPLVIDDVRIGDTKIEEYDEVEVSHNYGDGNGWTNGQLISTDISEENLAVVLNNSDGYTLRTTEPEVDKISVDITFPGGLVEITDQGDKRQRNVDVDVEYAPAGSGNWVSATSTATKSATQISTGGLIHDPYTGGGGGVGPGGP